MYSINIGQCGTLPVLVMAKCRANLLHSRSCIMMCGADSPWNMNLSRVPANKRLTIREELVASLLLSQRTSQAALKDTLKTDVPGGQLLNGKSFLCIGDYIQSLFNPCHPTNKHLLEFRIDEERKKEARQNAEDFQLSDQHFSLLNFGTCATRRLPYTVSDFHLVQCDSRRPTGTERETSLNKTTSDQSTEGSDLPDSQDDLPTEGQLQAVYDNLQETVPVFFKSKPNINFWRYHSLDIEFVDNIRNARSRGLYRYALCTMWIKLLVHMKFGYMGLDILKMTQHLEEGTIKMRWRIRGLPGWKVMYNFWKFKLWKHGEEWARHEQWYDGFSTFYIDGDGNIFRHVIDKVIPDDDRAVRKPGLVERLRALVAAPSSALYGRSGDGGTPI